jgi:hypothetical protein
MHCHTTVFIPELDKFVVVFIDDIFVYLKNMEEHEEYLQLMLQRLRDHQVFFRKIGGGGIFFSHLLKWGQPRCRHQDLNPGKELPSQWTYHCTKWKQIVCSPAANPRVCNLLIDFRIRSTF